MKRIYFVLMLLLASCDQRPPAPTAEENAQLNEAEAMLNEEGPGTEAPSPSNSD
jgi:hypothetical protein